MRVFQVSDLTVNIAKKQLCCGLSFALQPGERLAVLGPNGAGKTTLLSVLTGSRAPQSGAVTYDGLAVHQHDRRLSVGSQFTNFPLYYRVGELLRVFQMSSPGKQERMSGLLSYLRPCLRHYSQHLSGGERKLISNYIAISLKSECLLLDEPTSSLDVVATQLVGELLQQDGRTLIFSGHDLREAMKITRRVLFLTGRQAYHFDLHQAEVYRLYSCRGQVQLPCEAPYQCCQVGDLYCLLVPEGGPQPPSSWQLQGSFLVELLLYQIFNLIRSAEERGEA